jgi:hypothetical protein
MLEQRLQEILAQLPWLERSCLLLSINAGFTQEEIADILDITKEEVSIATLRGREQFRRVYSHMSQTQDHTTQIESNEVSPQEALARAASPPGISNHPQDDSEGGVSSILVPEVSAKRTRHPFQPHRIEIIPRSVSRANPFGTLTTIREPEQFFGRTEALDYLYSEIVFRRCVSVVGIRRIGKSSLLRCMCLPQIQEAFRSLYNLEKYLLVFIDLGEFLSKTSDDFFLAVCTQLITQSTEHLVLEMPQKVGGSDAFCQLLDEIQRQGFYPVLLLDAFHQVASNTHFDARFFSFLRAQANHGRVSYVTASIVPLDQCCHTSIEGSPFFNIFSVYRLGPLEEDEARHLLLKLTASIGHSFTDEEAEMVFHLAGRHPFFIQRVAFCLLRAKYQSYGSGTKVELEAYRDLFPHFKNIWESSLSNKQREHLREEMYCKQSEQKKVPELSESTLFRRFVREISDIQPVDIFAEYLEDILNHFGDTKFLGECELTHLYIFHARIHNSLFPRSIHEKGIMVRHILQEARDKLRPPGRSSNTAPEWQYFNILNYRFFKYSMKNEVLADLLGISVRQLHRVRHLAIEALQDVLYEMEFEARNELASSPVCLDGVSVDQRAGHQGNHSSGGYRRRQFLDTYDVYSDSNHFNRLRSRYP